MAYCAPRGIALSAFLAWPQSDQDAALAWVAFESERCQQCGMHPVDTAAARIEAHTHVCLSCAERERFTARMTDQQRAVPGLQVRTTVQK